MSKDITCGWSAGDRLALGRLFGMESSVDEQIVSVHADRVVGDGSATPSGARFAQELLVKPQIILSHATRGKPLLEAATYLAPVEREDLRQCSDSLIE